MKRWIGMNWTAFKISNNSIHMNAEAIPFLAEFNLMRLTKIKLLYFNPTHSSIQMNSVQYQWSESKLKQSQCDSMLSGDFRNECMSMLFVRFRLKRVNPILCCQVTSKLNASQWILRNLNWKTMIAIECLQAIWKLNAS